VQSPIIDCKHTVTSEIGIVLTLRVYFVVVVMEINMIISEYVFRRKGEQFSETV
jgi:hypothetical protein